MTPLAYHADRRTLTLLLLTSLGFVALGVWLLSVEGLDAWIGWLNVLFFGAGAVVFARQMASSRSRLVIDDDGILDRTLGVGVIAWDDVLAAWPYEVGRHGFVGLELRDPDVYRRRTGPVKRAAMRGHAALGYPPLSLNLTALKGATAAEVAAVVLARIAERDAG